MYRQALRIGRKLPSRSKKLHISQLVEWGPVLVMGIIYTHTVAHAKSMAVGVFPGIRQISRPQRLFPVPISSLILQGDKISTEDWKCMIPSKFDERH